MTKRIISVYVVNQPGVLVRISQIFARRGYNIDSLVVSPDLQGKFSRMTITAIGDAEILEQIIKQVYKLVDVVHVTEHRDQKMLEKELMLIKVLINQETKAEILQFVNHFNAKTVDFTESSLVIQVTGNTEKLDAMLETLRKFSIQEIVRTGKILMARGRKKT